MTERERLIKLLRDIGYTRLTAEDTTNYLLKNGVIVTPVKAWDTVYVDSRILNSEYNGLIPCSVISIVRTRKQLLVKITPVQVRRNGGRYSLRVPASAFGKTVFLSREEAAKALEEKE